MDPKPNNLPLYLTFIFILILVIARASRSTASSEISPSSGSASSSTVDMTQSSSVSPAPAPTEGLVPETNKCRNLCQNLPYLIACFQKSPTDPKEVFVVVRNDGEGPLIVNVTISHTKTTLSDIKIPKHEARKIDVSAIIGSSRSVVLRTGNRECVIQMGLSVSDGNIFKQISLYTTHGTPIYGAYLLFLSALIIGVTLACCKSRKSERQGDGVPYQELEMGNTESVSAEDVETKEGWDQDWDDDWGEPKQVKSPGGRQLGNVSVNGLNSRSSDKDGWENNWDD